MSPLFLFALLLCSLLFFFLLLSNNKARRGHPPLPPGPKGWPVLGNLPQVGEKPHQTLHKLSKTYGPLFRLRFGSVEVIIAASADVAAQFLRTHDANFCNRPPNSGAEHIAYNYQDLVFAPYGARWRMLRKLCTVHLFSQKAMDDLQPVRAAEVAVMVRALHERARSHETVNLGRALIACTTNALSKALLGRRVFEGDDVEAGKEAGEFKEMGVELMVLAGAFNIGDFVPWLRPFDVQGLVGRMKKVHRRFDKFLDKVIEEHESQKEEVGDLLSVLMSLKKDDEGAKLDEKLTNTDIKALLLNLFTAGTDTSSSTVEWAISELIRHPDILKKAQSELDSVVGRDRLVRETDLPNLPYLQAIIKETFRLHPSTPLSIPRMASEACQVNGYHIPKNATVMVNVWAIARDPAVWNKPLEFRPARFLPGGGYEEVDVKGNDFGVIPFGAGRRICVGLSLGLRMVQFLTATLVHAFDWGLPDAGKLDMEEAFGLTLQKAVPLLVPPVARLSQKAYEFTSC